MSKVTSEYQEFASALLFVYFSPFFFLYFYIIILISITRASQIMYFIHFFAAEISSPLPFKEEKENINSNDETAGGEYSDGKVASSAKCG